MSDPIITESYVCIEPLGQGTIATSSILEGDYVLGHEGVCAYWTKQWKQVDPHVEPLSFTPEAERRIMVDVHLLVNELQGGLLEDEMVQHNFRMDRRFI